MKKKKINYLTNSQLVGTMTGQILKKILGRVSVWEGGMGGGTPPLSGQSPPFLDPSPPQLVPHLLWLSPTLQKKIVLREHSLTTNFFNFE